MMRIMDMTHKNNHPVLRAPCATCGVGIGDRCVSTVPSLNAGSVGTPITGYHAERLEKFYQFYESTGRVS